MGLRGRRKKTGRKRRIPSQPKEIVMKDDEMQEKEIVMEDDEIIDEKHQSSVFDIDHLDHWPFPAGPAVEVLSVSIFSPQQSDTLIRGQITTTDYLKKRYAFYFSEQLMPIKPGWNELDLCHCPIAPVSGHFTYKLIALIKHAAASVFDNVYDMSKAVKRPDGTFFLQGDGNFGYCFRMVFTKTQFATIATVTMSAKLDSRPSEEVEEYYPIHGKITVNKFVCFDIKHDKPLRLKYGTIDHVPIRRYFYAVPVDSALAVEVELYNGTRCIMNGKKHQVQAAQRSGSDPPKIFLGCEVDKFFDFGIHVEWDNNENFFANGLHIKFREPHSPGALVEVFSVYSCNGNSSASCGTDIYGAVVVCDGDEKFNILASNKDFPGNLPSFPKNDKEQCTTLSLKWPDGKWVLGENFEFYLKLKDGEGKLVCVGTSTWNSNSTRYDCRLCDTFRGVDGYLAAVHYSVFRNGKKAKVSIECCNGLYSIYGSVFAKYKDYEYSSRYEEQCYQSILFKRSKEDTLEVTSSQICLLKSQVSAPFDCNELIVCVDLWVRPLREYVPHKRFVFNTNEIKSLPHKRSRFNTNDAKSCDMIWGTRDLIRGRLNVKVDWV